MCGILAVFGLTGCPEKNRRELLRLSKLLRHRGPDANAAWSNADGTAWLLHERLTIIDVTDAGRQPFVIEQPEGRIAWCMNSEVYNHEQLREEQVGKDVHIPSGSDSAVLGYMYQKHGTVTNEMLNKLDGIFAAALYDEATGDYFVARDPIGICPLYWGQGADGSMWFASEMKALQDHCVEFSIFPPGHIYRSSTGTLERWYNPKWLDMDYIPTEPANLTKIRESFETAVVKRLMSDVPLGVLLSGGLDSSLVASVASRHFAETKNAYHEGANKLHTFSIGIAGSPDLVNARKVAAFLDTEHHEFTFTVEDGIDALSDLIWHIESFEQVRAAVPMYLLARKIKALGIKVVLSGEGADEAFGGYLYFHKAPNAAELHRETVRKVERLHLWDVLRANKACFAWGLEPRVPFLDRHFLDVCMDVDPAEKMCRRSERPDGVHPRSEKYLLRKAFDTPERPFLPEEVLWRQKEQFSDGVGYDWVDGLKDYAAQVVTDEMWAARNERFPVDPPRTREYYLLRSLFEAQFPSYSALQTVPLGLSVACSTPEAVSWDPAWQNVHEISGRAVLDVHDAADGFQLDVQPLDAVPANAPVKAAPSGAQPPVRAADRERVVAKALPELPGVPVAGPEARVLGGLKGPSPLGRKMSPARAGRGVAVRRF